jgi:hypothetical protein
MDHGPARWRRARSNAEPQPSRMTSRHVTRLSAVFVNSVIIDAKKIEWFCSRLRTCTYCTLLH